MSLNNLPVHEKFALMVCAYRLDKSVSAEQFVEILERYERAVREHERVQTELTP